MIKLSQLSTLLTIIFLLLILGVIIYRGISMSQEAVPGKASGNWSSSCNPVSEDTLTPVPVVSPDGKLYLVTMNPSATSIKLYLITPPCTGTLISTLVLGPPNLAMNKNNKVLGEIEGNKPHIKFNKHGDLVVTYRTGRELYYVRKLSGSSSFSEPVFIANDAYQGDIGIDSSGNVYTAWYGPGGYYKKFDANDKSITDTITLTNNTDSEPKIDIDSDDNVHLVWMEYPAPVRVVYQKIDKTGSKGVIKTILQDPGNSVYPYIKVDSNFGVHIAMVSAPVVDYQATYVKCEDGGVSCGSPHRFGNGLAIDLAVCGQTPFMAWYSGDSGQYEVYTSLGLGERERVSPGQYGSFPGITGGSGKVHIFYRTRNGAVGYVNKDHSSCGESSPTPQPTATLQQVISSVCQGNLGSSARCFDCKKDSETTSQINILDFACFSKYYGKKV